MTHTVSLSSQIDASVERVWDWHARPGALERLLPPWVRSRIIRRSGVAVGERRTEIEISLGPGRVTWIAEHRDSEPGRGFTDVMLGGPFASWTHHHRFEPVADGCRLTDRVEYRLPCGPIADVLAGPAVASRLRRMFEYRHRITAGDLALDGRYFPDGPRRFLITGSSGLIGSALAALLSAAGHRVTRLVRKEPSGPDPLGAHRVPWDPACGRLEPAHIEGFDAVVHLAGENIAAGPWSAERKARIRSSRIDGTALLSEALGRTGRPPDVLVCASAAGFYGDRGETLLDEAAGGGSGFLAETSAAWEDAARPASEAGIRVVHLRIGLVLTPAGGALGRMLPVFRMGLGGSLGSGNQFWSWITLDDLLGAILHAAATDRLEGPVNAVTPQAVRNREFTETLGRVLGRPAVLRVPAAALRLAMGEMADEMLLGGARIVPRQLLDSGYAFRYPDLERALRHVLGRLEEAP